jgi:NAD+ kinase
MLSYRSIGLTVKPNLSEKEETVSKIVGILREQGAEIFIDEKAMSDVSCVRTFKPISEAEKIDLYLVIGGDGTILRSMRELPSFDIPILSVNRGVVGFLAEVSMDKAKTDLPHLLSGEGTIEERSILHVSVLREKKEVFQSFALNEAAISQGAIARLLDLQTDINEVPLATFHADGLIVATPTGSTAYSLAAGGPVVHPHLSALILTPINPHSLTQKPVVIPGKSIVGCDVVKSDYEMEETHVSLTLDGQVYFALNRNDRVVVRMHDQTVKFIRSNKDTFFHTLRTKLRWGERL